MSRNTRSAPRTGVQVDCPSCGNPALFSPDNPWRPFCSKRCKTIDMGAWASEQYRIPGSTPDLSSDDPDPGS